MAEERNEPLSMDRDRLESLPQRFDIWQLDSRPIVSEHPADQPVQLWIRTVVSRTDDHVLALDVSEGEPTLQQVWQTLLKAIQQPETGEPHRPTQVQLKNEKRADAFGSLLHAINVECEVVEVLDQIDEVFGELVSQLPGQGQVGLLAMPGVTPEAVGSFFDAAAIFFEQTPWHKTGERPIQIECGQFESGPWYAVLMGQGGMTRGLILYDNLETLHRIQQGNQSEEENAYLTAGLVVTFEKKEELLPADLVAAQKHAWQVAGEDAYPSVYRMEPGLNMRPPLSWELQLLEGCLRGIPEFARKKTRRLEPMAITVPTAGGELSMVLSWASG